jgi:hypothetical protein
VWSEPEEGAGAAGAADGAATAGAKPGSLHHAGLGSIVATLALTDLAFSLDSVAAAVAVSDRLWLVMAGGVIGVIALRLTAARDAPKRLLVLVRDVDKQVHPSPDDFTVLLVELLGQPQVLEMINLVVGEAGPRVQDGVLKKKILAPRFDLVFERQEVTDEPPDDVGHRNLVLDENPDNHKITLLWKLLNKLVQKGHELSPEISHELKLLFFHDLLLL